LAVPAVFPQTKNNTNNFPKNRLKTHKVNSLSNCCASGTIFVKPPYKKTSYEFWSGGDRLTKSSRYIPKKLLVQVQQLDADKAPVREILEVLGVL
jgi:hypothetical protein